MAQVPKRGGVARFIGFAVFYLIFVVLYACLSSIGPQFKFEATKLPPELIKVFSMSFLVFFPKKLFEDEAMNGYKVVQEWWNKQ